MALTRVSAGENAILTGFSTIYPGALASTLYSATRLYKLAAAALLAARKGLYLARDGTALASKTHMNEQTEANKPESVHRLSFGW